MREPFDIELVRILIASHARLVGVPLVTNVPLKEAAQWLYAYAPFCVVVHNTDPDPLFTYANKAAQRCFEYSWEEFVGMPSRLSAEAHNREERQRLLEAVARDGFATGYCGRRIAKSGRRFWIEDV